MAAGKNVKIYIGGVLVGELESFNYDPDLNTKDILDLNKSLNEAIENEDFERAAKIRDYISSL